MLVGWNIVHLCGLTHTLILGENEGIESKKNLIRGCIGLISLLEHRQNLFSEESGNSQKSLKFVFSTRISMRRKELVFSHDHPVIDIGFDEGEKKCMKLREKKNATPIKICENQFFLPSVAMPE